MGNGYSSSLLVKVDLGFCLNVIVLFLEEMHIFAERYAAKKAEHQEFLHA